METLELLFASLVRETAEAIRNSHMPFAVKD